MDYKIELPPLPSIGGLEVAISMGPEKVGKLMQAYAVAAVKAYMRPKEPKCALLEVKPRCRRFNSVMFIVRTPAGFREALEQYSEETNRTHRNGYPPEFPCLVGFEQVGDFEFDAVCTSVERYTYRLRSLLTDLETECQRTIWE